MNMLKIFYAVIFIFGTFPSWSAQEMMIEDKENYSSNRPDFFMSKNIIKENILHLSVEIEKSYEKGDIKKINAVYKKFIKLAYEAEQWKKVGQEIGVIKWLSQSSWKEALGGHLFFPKEIIDWEINYMKAYLLNRVDIIRALAISTKFFHPLSAYYLANILDNIHSLSTDAQKPNLYMNLYTRSFKDLEKYLDNSDAFYVLGRSYHSRGVLMGRSSCENAIEYHSKSTDLRNQYQLLELKESYRLIYSPPLPEEYLALARSGYHLAYIKTSELTQEIHRKLQILNEATEKGYALAYVEIGEIYMDLYNKYLSIPQRQADAELNLNKARQYFEEAGIKGEPESYVILGQTYVGDIILNNGYEDRKNFKKISQENKEKAIQFFRLAGEASCTTGWDYLAQLYLNIYEQIEEGIENEQGNLSENLINRKEIYARELYESLIKGIALGSSRAYSQVYRLYSREVFNELCKEYGPNPYTQKFREDMENFLYN